MYLDTAPPPSLAHIRDILSKAYSTVMERGASPPKYCDLKGAFRQGMAQLNLSCPQDSLRRMTREILKAARNGDEAHRDAAGRAIAAISLKLPAAGA